MDSNDLEAASITAKGNCAVEYEARIDDTGCMTFWALVGGMVDGDAAVDAVGDAQDRDAQGTGPKPIVVATGWRPQAGITTFGLFVEARPKNGHS